MSKWGNGRGGRPWRRKRLEVFARDMYRCQSCKRVTATPECDHIKPTSQGGTDAMDNLQTLCVDCHLSKTQQEANGGRPVREVVAVGMDGWPIEREARTGTL